MYRLRGTRKRNLQLSSRVFDKSTLFSLLIFMYWIKKGLTGTLNRPIRLTQCCTQLKSFGNKFQVFPYHLNVNAVLSYK